MAYKIAIIEDDQAISQMYRIKFEAEGFVHLTHGIEPVLSAEYFNARVRNPNPRPLWVPTPRNLGMIAALRGLGSNVRRTIAEHQESGEPAAFT